jgi:inorganic pyrophosphatase
MKKIIYIETPKGSFVKRNENQMIDFVSPLPCPFNYGHIKGEIGGDGDPLDALLLGGRVAIGTEVTVNVVGCVHFIDCGKQDDKFIVMQHGAPTRKDKRKIKLFFLFYAFLKRISAPIRGYSCQSTVLNIEYYNYRVE